MATATDLQPQDSKLIDAFVHNPVKVAVGVLLVALFGFIAVYRMPKQLTPEVQTPTITVETRWPGASPQEVEREIVQEQEEQLKSVEGLTKLSSESMDSVGTVEMEFRVGTNMEEALLKVNSRLQQVPEYPEDADEPVIETSSASDRPIAWFILSAKHPTPEEIHAFADEHPELADDVRPVAEIENAGLALLKLRILAEDHPEVQELLPPEDIEVVKLGRFAENNIEARFERVPGVANSNVIGGLEDELQVIVDPQKLAHRNLTIGDVRRVLRAQNDDISGGDLWEGKRRWVVRTLGQFDSAEDVEQQLLTVQDGSPVYVRDVAEVQHGYKKPTGLVRRFGESAVAVNVERETGANVLEVMEGLRKVNTELNETLLHNRHLQLTQVYDETDYINSSIGLVQQNIFIGGALTMIILMLFLHRSVKTLVIVPFVAVTAVAAAYVSPWFFAVCLALILLAGFWFARGALVVGLAIPTSIIGTFLMLQILGRSLNVISLAGMAFAVGMLVDNAVVVLENVYRHHQLGRRPFAAAVKGTQEVWGAVAASTLTTIAVFLPVVFVQEEAGQLFRDIALAISSAVGLSLVVSMTLIPTSSARLFGEGRSRKEPEGQRHLGFGRTREDGNGRPQDSRNRQTTPAGRVGVGRRLKGIADRSSQAMLRPLDAFGTGFINLVVGLNAWIQRGVLRRLAVVGLLVGVAVGLSYALWPKVEYLPTGNRNLVFGILLPPPGYNLKETMEIGEFVETKMKPYWDPQEYDPESGSPMIGDFFFVARNRQVFLGVRAKDPLRASELVPMVQRICSQVPGTFVVASQSSLFERGLSGGRKIDVEITGPELKKLVGLGGRVLGNVKQLMPEAQVRPVPSLDLSSPELHVEPKLVQAAEMGVSTSELGYAVDALVDGAYAGDYYIGGDKIDLTIKGRNQYSRQTQDVEALPVATPAGELVPLEALAHVQLGSGPEQINHRERQRAITVEVTPPPSMALEDAMRQINTQIVTPLIESGTLGDEYIIHLAGTADKLRDTWLALRFNVLLALLITYLLMAALFESWLYPFVIILTVPLGAVGGILGLKLLNVYLHWTSGLAIDAAVLNVWNNELLQQLDVLTMLGFVILIGTVVNNPILIVHQSLNHMRYDGMQPREAILESVRTRIRPIFMTTMTTVLALLPLVLFPGAGSELYRGLGSVVLGGLIVSTVFTLFLVPTVFSLTMDIKSVLVRLFKGREPMEVEQAHAAEREQEPAVAP